MSDRVFSACGGMRTSNEFGEAGYWVVRLSQGDMEHILHVADIVRRENFSDARMYFPVDWLSYIPGSPSGYSFADESLDEDDFREDDALDGQKMRSAFDVMVVDGSAIYFEGCCKHTDAVWSTALIDISTITAFFQDS